MNITVAGLQRPVKMTGFSSRLDAGDRGQVFVEGVNVGHVLKFAADGDASNYVWISDDFTDGTIWDTPELAAWSMVEHWLGELKVFNNQPAPRPELIHGRWVYPSGHSIKAAA